MPAYQEKTALSPTRRDRPTQEIRMARNGALLSAAEARYDTLDEYVIQFGAPMSILRGAGLYTFADPLCPQRTILVQCVLEPCCDRCHQALAECGCPF